MYYRKFKDRIERNSFASTGGWIIGGPNGMLPPPPPSLIVTFSIGFKLVTLNLTFGKRLANVYVLCRHIFDV